jgi:hypothetical protein
MMPIKFEKIIKKKKTSKILIGKKISLEFLNKGTLTKSPAN